VSTGTVIIRAAHSGLCPAILEAMRDELEACGLSGTLSIGEAHGHPDLFALMWMVGTQPVLMGVPKVRFADPESASLIAGEFGDKVRAASKPLPVERLADDYDYGQ